MSEEKAEKLIDNIVEALNRKFYESKDSNKRVKVEKVKTEE